MTTLGSDEEFYGHNWISRPFAFTAFSRILTTGGHPALFTLLCVIFISAAYNSFSTNATTTTVPTTNGEKQLSLPHQISFRRFHHLGVQVSLDLLAIFSGEQRLEATKIRRRRPERERKTPTPGANRLRSAEVSKVCR